MAVIENDMGVGLGGISKWGQEKKNHKQHADMEQARGPQMNVWQLVLVRVCFMSQYILGREGRSPLCLHG